MIRIFLLLAALVMAPACNFLQDSTNDDVIVSLDEAFQLSVGDTGILGNELQITFQKLTSDSRCPLDVQCVWEGEIEAAFLVATSNASDTIVFKGFLGNDEDGVLQQLVDTYGIELQRVDPYPTQQNGNSAKTATLCILRVGIR